MKRLKLKKWVKITLPILFFCVFAFSAYKLILYIIDTNKIKETTEEIKTVDPSTVEGTDNSELVNPPSDKDNDYWNFINTPYIDVDFEELLSKNSDTVAWLKVENTNINYPIVQTKDNNYYLKKAFDKSYNGAGWLFMDYRNDSKNFGTNTIIYGHSMLNTTMFGTLLKTKKASWYENKDNWVIKLSTPNEYTLWQVFSIYSTEAENYYIKTEFNGEKSIEEFLDTILTRSIYNFNTDLISSDKILTLSTCTSTGEDGRYVLHAKLIKREIK